MAEKPLTQVYLLNGDDALKQEMLLERLMKRIAEVGDLSLNSQVFSGKDLKTPDQILDALNTIPFGSPFRLVVVKEADRLVKEVQGALVSYIEHPLVTTVLVLVADKLAMNTRLYKVIQSNFASSIIDCSQKKRSELPKLIRNIAKAEGVDISPAATREMLERLGVSTVTLSNETKKLASIIRSRGDSSITERDVIQHVSRLAEPKQWDLANALAKRDASLCLRLIDRMKGFTAAGLFALCIASIREILTAMILKKRGVSVAQALRKQDWQIKELLQGTELYRQDELEDLLKKAPEIESLMKSGADADELLKLWIIEACA